MIQRRGQSINRTLDQEWKSNKGGEKKFKKPRRNQINAVSQKCLLEENEFQDLTTHQLYLSVHTFMDQVKVLFCFVSDFRD
jgi:hypothetical protein